MLSKFLPHISCVNLNSLNFDYLKKGLDIKVLIMDIDDTLTLHNK